MTVIIEVLKGCRTKIVMIPKLVLEKKQIVIFNTNAKKKHRKHLPQPKLSLIFCNTLATSSKKIQLNAKPDTAIFQHSSIIQVLTSSVILRDDRSIFGATHKGGYFFFTFYQA